MDDPLVDELRAALDGGNLLIFAGPAVSTAAGLPGLPGLAQRAIERLKSRGAPADQIAEVVDLHQRGKALAALVAAREGLGAPDFGVMVDKALDLAERPVPEIALAVASLDPKLRGVLSVGLDRVLERAFAGAWDAVSDPPGDLASRRRFLLKLHGTLRDQASWIFARDRGRRALFDAPKVEAAFLALYRSCPILFLGFGPDDGLDEIVTRARAGAQPPAHFALLSWAKEKPARSRSLEAAGVRILRYEREDELPGLVRALGRSAPPASVVRSEPSTSAAPRAPVRVVACFASEDEALFAKLDDHLSALKAQKAITLWHEGRVLAGQDRRAKLDEELAVAEVLLLLLSADLLASDESQALIARALARRGEGSLELVPVRLRPCDWEGTGLDQLPALPPDGTTVAGANEDAALLAVARGLRALVARRRG